MTPDSTQDADDGILTPDDLRLDDDRVDELGDNRYLVRSDGSAAASDPAVSETLPAVDMNANANANTNTNANAGGGKPMDADTSSSNVSVNPFDFPLADAGVNVDADADRGLESIPGSHESDAVSGSREPDTALEPDEPITTAESHLLESTTDPHGIDITLKTDGELAHLQTTSKDVREVFAEMLTWYADQLDDDLSPAQVLEVMLATTDLEA
ncbi:DUF7500 family protein [Halomontanus rarus]|uniref:DUF7500 family protein n=1 Tax=Halomontanus rarus TaxID=3034020 RepID=UPI0023E85124|nr:hypothetical protein [Halovivax sp. TS33]